MVVKKSNIVSIAVMLGLALAPMTFADNANSLVQLDLKKTSGDSVNVTLFTTGNYDDNVMVRKKSDNKYVILIPKVHSSGYSASNLSGVRDLISSVDVKTVEDTSGGYTKVTLITTKPLDIKTSTRKSTPITEDQREYQTLIAQANAVKNNVSTLSGPPKLREQKTEVTVNKAPAQSKNVEPKKVQVKNPEIKLVEIDPEKFQRQVRREHLAEMMQDAKDEQSLQKDLPALPDMMAEEQELQQPAETQNINKVAQKVSILSKIKQKAKNLPKKNGIILLSLLGLIMMIKSLKNISKQPINTQRFIDNLVENPSEPEIDTISNIINNKELSWREKYQMYLDKSAVPVSRGKSKGNYMFIKTPNIEKKREKLERLVTRPMFDEIQPEIIEEIPEIVENEDEVISKAIKFKAFDNRVKSLKMTSRDKSRFRKYEVEIPLHEQKNIELGDSMLHSNPRSFANANLKVSDVDKNRITYEPKEYIMSSVDEYLSILDSEQSAPVIPQEKPVINVTNPISKHKNENKSSYLKGLIVKSGFKIDEDKGFYLVNQDGKNSLIGKINDEVFVLKNFDTNVTNPIQVRHDKDNVYMVKAGDFKSLVEVNEDKMGVLIEL